MHRFANTPAPTVPQPQSITMVEKFSELKKQRVAMDQTIQTWAPISIPNG